ncbi:hypothetical protein HYDPIDRAFT_85108 [Hydnomerulius pinastri MD-312]|nr:hypothetical protein HYDPIDRAFT_85108 [Hydnomerulius pinastri MD-312]
MTLRHTLDAAGTSFTVNRRYRLLNESEQQFPARAVAVEDQLSGEDRVIRKFDQVHDNLSQARRCLREIRHGAHAAWSRFLRHFKGHDNIARLYDIDINFHLNGDFGEVYLIEECFERDLHEVIRLEHPFRDDQVQAIFHQVLRGLNYIHSAGVIHPNLTPGNIFMGAKRVVKIGAFGDFYSCSGLNISDETVVDPYQAPEILANGTLTVAANIWSLGCILAELIGGEPIFKARNPKDHLRQVVEVIGVPVDCMLSHTTNTQAGEYMTLLQSAPCIPMTERYLGADPRVLDLLSDMLRFDPTTRITCRDALVHTYLENTQEYGDDFVCFPVGPLNEKKCLLLRTTSVSARGRPWG